MHDVAIIGAGIAGLSAAHRLRRAGADVVMLEAADCPGGNMRSLQRDGFTLDLGPQSFLATSDALWTLIEEAGMLADVEAALPTARDRYVFRDGRLTPIPTSPLSFIGSRLLSTRGKLRLMLEPLIPGKARVEDTAWDFFVRRFGEEAATYLMGPFVSGIYAGDARRLGAEAAFPKFHSFEREHGSMIIGALKYKLAQRRAGVTRNGRKGLYSYRGGLGAFTSALTQKVGVRLLTGSPVTGISGTDYGFRLQAGSQVEARAVICAVPPAAAANLLAEMVPQAPELLQQIPLAPVCVVHWSQPANRPFPNGFGFLMPRHCGFRVLGTVFASNLFDGRAPSGHQLAASYYGGVQDPDLLNLKDEEVLALVLKEHETIFGWALEDPRLVNITRYTGAIPQLQVGHPELIDRLQAHISQVPGLLLAGNFLTGVSMDHAVMSGFAAAERALQNLGQKTPAHREAA